MDWEDVIEIPPWGNTADWKELNNAIRHLITRHAGALQYVEELAFQIRDLMDKLFPEQDALVRETCWVCHEPCCTTATIWLDFCDVIFLHMTGQTIPDMQLIERQPDMCRFHTQTGCALPRLSRPWVCTLYFCPPQKAIIRSKGEDYKEGIETTMKQIKELRRELEERFIRVTSGCESRD